MALTNLEIFELFCDLIRGGATNEELMKEYGGSSIPVPSYKLHGRDDEIRRKFVEEHHDPKELARQYDLSLSQIYRILEPVRKPKFEL